MMNEQRFETRDNGYQRAEEDRQDFLKKEDRRHKTKMAARERILKNISAE
jgi:hypothetical protein